MMAWLACWQRSLLGNGLNQEGKKWNSIYDIRSPPRSTRLSNVAQMGINGGRVPGIAQWSALYEEEVLHATALQYTAKSFHLSIRIKIPS
jgi:hypothetical protein